ncbi:MAG: ParB/RepB/Spo0J family partition protein, partial [Patescibacteria group bacterium]
ILNTKMTLGKGLESLIPPQNNKVADNQAGQQLPPSVAQANLTKSDTHSKKVSTTDAIFHIEVDKISPNPYQPRKDFNEESLKELAASIRELGIIQPLIVSKIEKETETGTNVEYQLIAGERRLKAAKIIGLERVPVIVKRINQAAEQMEMAIVENIQRMDLNPVETARAYARLSDEFGLTQREIAVKLGKSRETVANTLRLLSLPTEIQDSVAEGKINESQARLLLAIDDLSQQRAFFHDILKNNLSVRELKNRIRKTQLPITNYQLPKEIDPEVHHLQERLEELLGAPVKIHPPAGGKEGGKIIISFFSSEEIKGIIGKINTNSKPEEERAH